MSEFESYTAPSLATLRTTYDEDTAQRARGLMKGSTDPETFDSVQRWVSQCFNQPSHVELVMRALDEILGTYGVEGIFADDDYSGRDGMSYCNTGESYDATIVFDYRRDRFLLSSWADWAESRGL